MRWTSKNEQELARETRGSGEFFPGKTSGTETGYSIQQSPLLWVSDLYLLNITGYCSWLISNKSFFMFLPFYFWPHLEACRIFEAMPSTVKAWHPKHWNSERNLKAIRCKASVFFFFPLFFFLKKFRNKTTIWPSNPTPRHIPWGNQNWKRHMYPTVHCGTIYNS